MIAIDVRVRRAARFHHCVQVDRFARGVFDRLLEARRLAHRDEDCVEALRAIAQAAQERVASR